MVETSSNGEQALLDAKKATLASQAELHRSRAKVARLIANQEEEAAEKIRARIGGKKSQSRPTGFKKQTLARTKQSNQRKKQQIEKGVSSNVRKKASRSNQASSGTPHKSQPLTSSSKPLQKSLPKKKAKRSKKRRGTVAIFSKRLTDWLGRRPPWVVSLATHGMLILLLFCLTFASFQEDPFVLTAKIAVTDDWAPEVPAVQLVNWEESVIDPSEALPEIIELETPVELPTIEPVASVMQSEMLYVSELGPSASLMTSEVSQKQESQEGSVSLVDSSPAQEVDGKVEFFGVTEDASRVVFVVDNSGSMQRGRMETTLDELNRAVQKLKPDQKFYVIFYSDQAYPMYYPDSVETLQFATRDNKKKLAKWLRTVEICLGGRLLDAVEMASSFDPQVVFLMSDGDIRSQRVMQSLTDVEEWDFTIHTFGMEVRTKQHADNLVAIAEANSGLFNVVDVRPKAIRRSMAKPIPYNRQPGEVWGSMVTVWN